MIHRRRSVPVVQRPQISAQEAGEKLDRVADTVQRLTELIVEESRLVRKGAYAAAANLERAKGELSSQYMLDVDALNANVQAVASQPQEAIEEVERLHAAFRAALDENLAVLGTARSVAESLLRGVAEEVGAKATPKTYDARGGSNDYRVNAAPITLSKGA